nr:MAG TPA: hypothetical protein [Caudoviricetes sp.]DAQ95625.1 MAG TPA: hypothetical protein [Caudoviricetes sp.]
MAAGRRTIEAAQMALPVVMHDVWQLYGITKSKLLQL